MTEDPLEHRKTAARMANRAREAGAPSDWFDPFYQWAQEDEARIPWADLAAHPLLVDWMAGKRFGRVAVVGCGLGDDSEELSSVSDSVWAFDVSSTAIEWTRRRHPGSIVEYETADLFRLDENRKSTFDLVVEIYTLQALPPEARQPAMVALVDLVAPGGELVVISRWREDNSELGPVPWPLLRSEFAMFDALGMVRTEALDKPTGEAVRVVWKKPT